MLNQRYYYNGENSFYLEYFTSFIHNDIDKQIKDNKYLKMLGNLKFYERKKQFHLSLSDSEKIDVNNFYENRYNFK